MFHPKSCPFDLRAAIEATAQTALRISLRLILLVAHVLQPIDSVAIKLLLDGDVRHSGSWRGSMPVLLSRLEPDNIAGPNLLDRAAFALRPATP